MQISFLLRGIVIGFSIAAPVGPIGVLCIRPTLAHGRTTGLVSGLGAAAADALYGCVAGFGLTFVSNLLVSQQLWFRLPRFSAGWVWQVPARACSLRGYWSWVCSTVRRSGGSF